MAAAMLGVLWFSKDGDGRQANKSTIEEISPEIATPPSSSIEEAQATGIPQAINKDSLSTNSDRPADRNPGNRLNHDTSDVANNGNTDSPEIRANELRDLYGRSARHLAADVEQYLSTQSNDSDWSDDAQATIEEWFDAKESGNKILSECIADVCYADFYMPFAEFSRQYMPNGTEFVTAEVDGFLPFNFYIRAGDDFFRFYFFKDSFDPAVL